MLHRAASYTRPPLPGGPGAAPVARPSTQQGHAARCQPACPNGRLACGALLSLERQPLPAAAASCHPAAATARHGSPLRPPPRRAAGQLPARAHSRIRERSLPTAAAPAALESDWNAHAPWQRREGWGGSNGQSSHLRNVSSELFTDRQPGSVPAPDTSRAPRRPTRAYSMPSCRVPPISAKAYCMQRRRCRRLRRLRRQADYTPPGATT